MNSIEKIQIQEPALYYVYEDILNHFLNHWGTDMRLWDVGQVLQCQLMVQLREMSDKMDKLIDNGKEDR